MLKHIKILKPGFRGILLLIFAASAAPLSAQAVWSGNASVDPAEFVNFVDDVPLAGASSSFTRNTVITVTNPQNNKTVDVTIVKRAPRPGVFLVLSEAAGKALSFPADQVIPVMVQVAENRGGTEYDEFNSTDPDINPAVSVPEAVPGETAEAEAEAETEITAEADESYDPFSDEILAVPSPGDDLRVVREPEEVEELEPEPEAVAEAEELPADDFIPEEYMTPEEAESGFFAAVPEEVSDETAYPEEAAETAVAEEPAEEPETPVAVVPETVEPSVIEELPAGDNVIYFLTPSDFRPPTQPIVTENETEEIVPVLVERDVLEGYIVEHLKNGSSYIQLGAYSSPESIYSEILSIGERYPMVVWTENRGGKVLYKFLVGPLSKDETGVLSYRFRESGYPDLFLYTPR